MPDVAAVEAQMADGKDGLRPVSGEDSSVSAAAAFGRYGRAGSIDSVAARDLFAKRLQRSELDFLNVTGDAGDIQKDEEWACGDTALTFENVGFSVRVKGGEDKVILAPLSGHFEPGTLVAVMGPSGSGKTTLLDILAGKKSSPYQGTVMCNGHPRDNLFERMSSYVAQDDIMPPYLTVREVISFHQSLKQERPSKVTEAMFQQRIERALQDLGLLGVENSRIGDKSVRGISGGQRKRVSLACGLASFPQIMFSDEPTSGLSSTDAETCVKYMRLIAHKYSVTILVVIHQPRVEVARLFDHLLLLTAGPGRCVYNGPMRDLPRHCELVGHAVPKHVNPTDFIMDLVTPGGPKSCEGAFVEYYEQHVRPTIDALVETQLHNERKRPLEILEHQREQMRRFGRLPPVQVSRYGVRFRKQLLIVGARQLTLYLRDSRGIIADLVISVGKGVILGLTFLHIGTADAFSQLSFFFMLMMAASIDGMKGMPKLVAERRVMKMETSGALYSEWAYIVPFTFISWLQAMMSNTIFVTVIFLISNLPWALYGPLWLWTSMLYFTMDSLFLMLSAAAKDASTAMVMALPFFMFFLLFNGFTISRATAQWFLVWIVDISPVAYSIEQAIMCARAHYQKVADRQDFDILVEMFGYRDEPWKALTAMFAAIAVFRIIQVLSLKFLNNIQR